MDVELLDDADVDALYAEVRPRLWRAILAYTGGRRELTDSVVAEASVRTSFSSHCRAPGESYFVTSGLVGIDR